MLTTRRTLSTATLAVTLLLATLTGVDVSAHGAPGPNGPATTAAATSKIVGVTRDDPQQVTLQVYSASMGKTFPVIVLLPRDTGTPTPVLYLLNGAGGGEGVGTWGGQTDYKSYFADKKVYVVTPVGGAYSYYTDWQRDDPVLGRNKWQTFLTKELPPLINQQFDTTGANALAAISMSGTSVFNVAIAKPGLYRSVAAFSGCARTSDPLGQTYIRLVVENRGGGNVVNMWGPLNGPGWRANDPYLNADRLRGTKIYMTTSSGLPGQHERLEDPYIDGNRIKLADQIFTGGIIEGAIDQCTRQMADRLRSLNIPADVTLRARGTHSWMYWQDDLHNTWPKIERDLAAG